MKEITERDFKEVLEEMENQFYEGARALYHYLQASIIGFSGNDAISIECKRFLKRGKNKKGEELVDD